jgi:hypothetical protein
MLTGTNELGQVGAIPLRQTCRIFVRHSALIAPWMEKASLYQVAFVGQITKLRTRHAVGLPGGPQQEMAPAQILVLEAQDDGSAMLYRYTADGADCGDTWHEDVEAAKEQAAWEYDDAQGMWAHAPTDCSELDAALRYARRLRTSRSRP